MDNLNIEATKYTPAIKLAIDGMMSFVGKSYPENTFEFYRPVLAWLNDYFSGDQISDKILIKFEIDYFNSSTSSVFYNLFEIFDAQREKRNILVHWCHKADDDSSLEAGEDFVEDFPDLDIQFIVQ